MTIPNVSAGENIAASWGNAVANAINGMHESGSYTPTLTDIAIGTGGSATNTASWVFVGGTASGDSGMITAKGTIIFGTSGFSITGSTGHRISMPSGFEAVAGYGENLDLVGYGQFRDAAGSPSSIELLLAQYQTAWRPLWWQGGSNTLQGISSTLPFTWAAGDAMYWHVSTFAVRT